MKPFDIANEFEVQRLLAEVREEVAGGGPEAGQATREQHETDQHRRGFWVAGLAELGRAFEGQAMMQRGLRDILAERARQRVRWGEQDHPSLSPGRPAWHEFDEDIAGPLGRELPIPSADYCRALVELASRGGGQSWALIALEEFAEAVDAKDDADRRGELVQLAAVILAWIEAIDRREGANGR